VIFTVCKIYNSVYISSKGMRKSTFQSVTDAIIRIAGEGGEGVISCGELLAQAAARTAYHVFTFVTYPAEMRGGYAMIQIRLRDWTIYSLGSKVDCLVVFNQQAFDRSVEDLKQGGTLIYDPEFVDPGEGENFRKVPVPFTEIAKKEAGTNRVKNIVLLGVLGRLYAIDKKILLDLIKRRYRTKGEESYLLNNKALSAGYKAVPKPGDHTFVNLSVKEKQEEHYMLLSGNEAVALGAIAAGCRFIASYPITPATGIFETLTRLMPCVGGAALQMEDEIASLASAIGASFAGEKVLVPTSGPGLQLMAEQISLASMVELPIVLIDVQRGGPSTGLPTKTEQSDMNFAVYGGAGDSPRLVLAPTSVEDSFYQTIRAFNLAERYQIPVIVLLDQSIGYRKATVRMPDVDKIFEVESSIARTKVKIPHADYINLVKRLAPSEKELFDYRRYKLTEDGVSPIASPGTPGGQYCSTGLEHTEYGKPDYSPRNHLAMSKKRQRKMEVISRSFDNNPLEAYGKPDAKIGIIGWGSTEGAIREARHLAEKEGVHVRHLHPHTISPLPVRQVSQFLVRLRQLIVVEENLSGQFAKYIKALFGVEPIRIYKCEGVPITPEEIYRGIMKVSRIVNEEYITNV